MTTQPPTHAPPLSDRERALLVGLADGTLGPRRRRRAASLARSLPGGDDLVARQRRVARALSGAAAPVAVTGAFVAPRDRRARVRSRIWTPAAAAAGLALGGLVVVAVAVALLVSGSGPEAVRVAEVATRPALAPAPAARAGEPGLLAAESQGVSFPDWGSAFDWRATGARRDHIEGRATQTVFYEHEGHRIAYTVVSGPALPVPAHAERIRPNGVEVALVHAGGHEVFAMFERNGRTCVLSGHVIHLSTLVTLAAWQGGGRVAF